MRDVQQNMPLNLTIGAIIALAVAIFGMPQKSAAEDLTLSLPDKEVRFIQANVDAQAGYDKAPNELKKTAIRKGRDHQLRAVLPEGIVKGWIGKLSKFGTTHDGAAYVEILLPQGNVSVGTWNNELADYADHTLIAFDSKIYKVLSEMQQDQWVVFDAKLLREGSMTEEGSITAPLYIGHITRIASPFVDKDGKSLNIVQ